MIIQTHDRTETIHPDKYPFNVSCSDRIDLGLRRAGVGTKEELKDAQRYFAAKNVGLPRMVEINNTIIGVVNLLELYALAQTLRRSLT